MKASWRDINTIQHDVAANADGWAEGGRVPSLCTEHRGMKAHSLQLVCTPHKAKLKILHGFISI